MASDAHILAAMPAREPLPVEPNALVGRSERERQEIIWEQLCAVSLRINDLTADVRKLVGLVDRLLVGGEVAYRPHEATLPGIQADAKSPSDRAREVAREVIVQHEDAERLARYDSFLKGAVKWILTIVGVVVAGLFLAYFSYRLGFAAHH